MLSRDDVKARRTEAGYSQAELAAVLGVTTSAGQKWENNQSSPTARTERALRVLNTPRAVQRRERATTLDPVEIALEEAGERRLANTVATMIEHLHRAEQ